MASTCYAPGRPAARAAMDDDEDGELDEEDHDARAGDGAPPSDDETEQADKDLDWGDQ